MNPRPVACKPLTFPADLAELHDWLKAAEREEEREFPITYGGGPMPGMSAAINRYVAAVSVINGMLKANGMLEDKP